MSLARPWSGWRWRLRRWSRRPAFGPLWWTAAALALALAAFWHWTAGVALHAQQRSSQLARAVAGAARPPADDQAQLVRQFVQALPPRDDVPQALQTLFDLADRQGLRLLRGSYRLDAEPNARIARQVRIARCRMTLPVQGDPAAVQRFIQAALLALPSLAVESLQFKREAGAPLEARIQWVLFVRDDARTAAARARPIEAGS